MTKEAVAVPLTLAERSDFRQTGRTDEVEQLCEAYAQRWPDAVHSFEYGRSAEGRPMRALLASRSGALSPIQHPWMASTLSGAIRNHLSFINPTAR